MRKNRSVSRVARKVDAGFRIRPPAPYKWAGVRSEKVRTTFSERLAGAIAQKGPIPFNVLRRRNERFYPYLFQTRRILTLIESRA